MYSLFYRYLQKIILKNSFYDDILKIIHNENIKHIVEIGCADSIILNNLDEKYFYNGFDVEDNFIQKSKLKFSNNKKYKFEKKSIHEIILDDYDEKETIILLVGVFHHVNDDYIKIFLKKSEKFKVYAIDAVRLKDHKFFTKLLMNFDKGKYVRFEDQYKRLLTGYDFILARNKYLNFKYDHLISIKNLNLKKIKNILQL